MEKKVQIQNKKNQQQQQKIYISGLPSCTSKEELKNFLKNFGIIDHIKLPTRKNNGVKECKGHAKVLISDEKTKNRVFDEIPKMKFKGKYTLKIELFLEGDNLVKKMAKIEEKKVSIFAPKYAEIEIIKAHMIKYGEVEDITWGKKEKKSEGFYGNVTFKSKKTVQKCLEIGEINIGRATLLKFRPFKAHFLQKNPDFNLKNKEEIKEKIKKSLKKVIKISEENWILAPKEPNHSKENTRFNFSRKKSHFNYFDSKKKIFIRIIEEILYPQF